MKRYLIIRALTLVTTGFVFLAFQISWSVAQETNEEKSFIISYEQDVYRPKGRYDFMDRAYVKEMFSGEYDKAISILKISIGRINNSRKDLPLWRYDLDRPFCLNGLRYRRELWTLANAYEFNGNLEEAYDVYQALFDEEDSGKSLVWIRARLEYAQDHKRRAFELACEAVEKNPDFLNMSRVFDENENPEDETEKPWIQKALYLQQDGLRTVRDRCAQIVNPKLHWTYDDMAGASYNKEAILTAKAYRDFLDFIEKEYEAAITERASKTDEDVQSCELDKARYEPLCKLFKKLAELPY